MLLDLVWYHWQNYLLRQGCLRGCCVFTVRSSWHRHLWSWWRFGGFRCERCIVLDARITGMVGRLVCGVRLRLWALVKAKGLRFEFWGWVMWTRMVEWFVSEKGFALVGRLTFQVRWFRGLEQGIVRIVDLQKFGLVKVLIGVEKVIGWKILLGFWGSGVQNYF